MIMDRFQACIPEDKRNILKELGEEIGAFQSRKGEFKSSEWKGYQFMPGLFHAETAKYVYNEVEYPENSVFIISFPKTGTHWTYEIVRQILFGHNKNLDILSKSIPLQLSGIEMSSVTRKFGLYQHIPLSRFLFFSHLPEELVNVDKIKRSKGKIIITLRNPKDHIVSLFHFFQGKIFHRLHDTISSDWTEFFNSYTSGKIPLLTKDGQWYIDHVLGWYNRCWGDKDALFLYYEDLQMDLEKEVKKMSEFLGVDLSETRLIEIIRANSFDAMKRETDAIDLKAATTLASMRKRANVMRKGQVGEWKEVLTVSQSRQVDKLVKEKLANTEIKFTYQNQPVPTGFIERLQFWNNSFAMLM